MTACLASSSGVPVPGPTDPQCARCATALRVSHPWAERHCRPQCRHPYVPKAQVAEQKAQEAPDELARARAYREAAHEWDRAAEREKPGKQRSEYEANAVRTRELAE